MNSKRTRERRSLETFPSSVAEVFGWLYGSFIIAAWFQHLYTCLMTDRWGLLVAGIFFPIIAIIHGVGVWLGLWH